MTCSEGLRLYEMMKMVNAHNRRVNSRRVGGVVHLECLIWRAKGAGKQVCQNPGKTVVFVRPSSPSSTVRSVFGVDEVLMGVNRRRARTGVLPRLTPRPKTLSTPTWLTTAKQCRWSVPMFSRSLLSSSCR